MEESHPFSPETLGPSAFAFREDRFLAASSLAEQKQVRYQGACETEVDSPFHLRKTARNGDSEEKRKKRETKQREYI